MPAKTVAKTVERKVKEPKVLTPATLERRARHKAKREQVQASSSAPRGLSVTMPKITWEWAAAMAGDTRWPSTRRARSVDSYMAQAKGGRQVDESLPLVIEPNPEAKLQKSKTLQKNGR